MKRGFLCCSPFALKLCRKNTQDQTLSVNHRGNDESKVRLMRGSAGLQQSGKEHFGAASGLSIALLEHATYLAPFPPWSGICPTKANVFPTCFVGHCSWEKINSCNNVGKNKPANSQTLCGFSCDKKSVFSSDLAWAFQTFLSRSRFFIKHFQNNP